MGRAVTDAGGAPEPSQSRHGWDPAIESRSAPVEPVWGARPAEENGFQGNDPSYGGSAPAAGHHRHPNSSLIATAAVVAVVCACGGYIVGRQSAPKPAPPVAAQTGVSGDGTNVSAAATVGFSVADPAGDAVPHPSEGRVYGPSDITNLSIRSDGTNLVITTVYTPETPMNLLAAETAIRLDADKVPSCKNSVLDSADWLIDYDIFNDGISVAKPAASCGDRYQHTSITGAVEVTGSTLTIKIAQDSLGIRSGQRIVLRASASTKIDDGHTTLIQDRAPDSSSGAIGTV